MKNYVTAFTEEIARLADAWGVYHKKVPLEGAGYSMDHTASVFLAGRPVEGHHRL